MFYSLMQAALIQGVLIRLCLPPSILFGVWFAGRAHLIGAEPKDAGFCNEEALGDVLNKKNMYCCRVDTAVPAVS